MSRKCAINMFENNPDYNFDDDIQLNCIVNKEPVPRKRPLDTDQRPCFKKPNVPVQGLSLPRNIVTRKFPGPAGLLPDKREFDPTLLIDNCKQTNKNNDELLCSQSSYSVFQSGPWVELSQDYNTLIAKYNIKWIKHKAALKKLAKRKAPFLAAIINNIECFDEQNPVVNVMLKDSSGEIQGTITHKLYEQYSESLVVGSAIVLKQFGVLTTGFDHHLTITPKNLVTVYSKNSDSEVIVNRLLVASWDEPAHAVKLNNDMKQARGVESGVAGMATEGEDVIWESELNGVDTDSFFEDF